MFIPPLDRNAALNSFVKRVENIPLANASTEPGTTKSNINQRERTSIKSLSSDPNIIIKEADKGGAVVIMNTKHYKEMSENILNDTDYYEILQNNPSKIDRIQYNRLLNRHINCLKSKEYKYLSDFEIKHSQFYGLP